MDNRFTFTYSDIKNLAGTKAKKITVIDLINDQDYQNKKTEIEAGNDAFTNAVDTLQKLNTNLSKAEAELMASRMGYTYKDLKEFENDYLAQLQEDADAEEKAKAYADAKKAYDEFMQVMGFNTQPAQPQPTTINLNAVVPAQTEEAELDEKNMSWKDRCDYIEELSTGSSHGNNQFRRHLSVRHQNIGAKALVKEWYKLGYITLAENNSLLFMCNINACSNHINVTARR